MVFANWRYPRSNRAKIQIQINLNPIHLNTKKSSNSQTKSLQVIYSWFKSKQINDAFNCLSKLPFQRPLPGESGSAGISSSILGSKWHRFVISHSHPISISKHWMKLKGDMTCNQWPGIILRLSTNSTYLIHDFTAVKFFVKLDVFHEIGPFPWNVISTLLLTFTKVLSTAFAWILLLAMWLVWLLIKCYTSALCTK